MTFSDAIENNNNRNTHAGMSASGSKWNCVSFVYKKMAHKAHAHTTQECKWRNGLLDSDSAPWGKWAFNSAAAFHSCIWPFAQPFKQRAFGYLCGAANIHTYVCAYLQLWIWTCVTALLFNVFLTPWQTGTHTYVCISIHIYICIFHSCNLFLCFECCMPHCQHFANCHIYNTFVACCCWLIRCIHSFGFYRSFI